MLAFRRLRVAFVVALATALALGPAVAATADEFVPPVVSTPADGASVSPDVVLSWEPVASADGYAVRWGQVGSPSVDEVAGTSVELVGLVGGEYVWEVRALPGGDWSPARSFTVVDELETYPLVDAPASPVPGIDGTVWVVLASAFSVVLLALVFHAAHRARREVG